LAGEYCVCAKAEYQQYIDVPDVEFAEYEKVRLERQLRENIKAHEEKAKTSANNIIDVYQSDFMHGTFRIVDPGTYNIMEDIIFDFNAMREDPFNDS
jgi:hypothetical protein